MKRFLVGAAAVALGLTMTACSQSSSSQGSSTSPSSSTSQSAAASAFPVEVKSCDETLKFNKAPERVLMLSETDAPILYDLGLLDHVIARAGQHRIPESQAEMRAALDKIKEVKAGDTGTGGAKMSTEAILDLNPDLVLGYDEGADRAALKAAGIPLYSPDAMCPNYALTSPATFDLVSTEIDKIAAIFGKTDKAANLKSTISSKLETLKKAQPASGTAAALFVMPGSTTFYSYGFSSMVQPIFEANGLANVYADKSDRVFEASMEDLLAKDPDWIVLMADSPDPNSAREVFNTYPGADKLKATKNNHVVFLPFILTDPPTTLSVQGAVELGSLIKG